MGDVSDLVSQTLGQTRVVHNREVILAAGDKSHRAAAGNCCLVNRGTLGGRLDRGLGYLGSVGRGGDTRFLDSGDCCTQRRAIYRTKAELFCELFLASRTKLHCYYLFLLLGKQCRIGLQMSVGDFSRITVSYLVIKRLWRFRRYPTLEQFPKFVFGSELVPWLDTVHFKPPSR